MNPTYYLRYLTLIGSRYFVVAGACFYIFYILFRKTKIQQKIQGIFPKNKDYIREILYSVLTIALFALIPTYFLQNEKIAGHTLLYKKISDKGLLYFFALFPVLVFIHDTYFYWTHRLMHHKLLFKTFHLVHHKSTNPSPWAAYAFHPLEAIVESGIFFILIFCIPMHKIHFLIFFFFSILYNIYGHLGWELYPKGFNKNWIGKWINTSVSHNQHHHYFKGNYGLYFMFWDRMMGTIREDYDVAYDEITNK